MTSSGTIVPRDLSLTNFYSRKAVVQDLQTIRTESNVIVASVGDITQLTSTDLTVSNLATSKDLIVTDSTELKDLVVTGLTEVKDGIFITSSGAPSPVNSLYFYDTLAINGVTVIFTSTQGTTTTNILFTRVGDTVTLTWDTITMNGTDDTNATAAILLPVSTYTNITRFLPAAEVLISGLIKIFNTGTSVGYVNTRFINPNGSILFYADLTGSTNWKGGTSIVYAGGCSYKMPPL